MKPHINQALSRKRRLGRAGPVVLVLVAMFAFVSPAVALPPPPENPSDDQIDQSLSDAQNAAAEVGRLSGMVSLTQGEIERLQTDLELKAELSNKAKVDLDLAIDNVRITEATAVETAQTALDSQVLIEQAEQQAELFAAASFRQGSELGSVSALFDAGSVDDILHRQQLLNAISGSQLDVISNLQQAKVNKANLDSQARQATLDAQTAQADADNAKIASDRAESVAAEAFSVGQNTLLGLQTQLADQQVAYEAANNTVSALQDQRVAYNDWLVLKAAEEERLRLEAEAARIAAEQARVAAEAEATRVAAEQVEAARLAAQAATQKQQEEAALAVAEAERQAARDAIALQEQAAAQAQAAAAAAPFYSTCDEARAAGRGPISTSEAGYRIELDPNANGIACEGKSTTLTAPVEEFYVTCDAARAAGRGPISKGESGYRAELDANSNGIACEGQAVYAASQTVTTPTNPSPALTTSGMTDRGQIIIEAAKRWIGTTYAWGGGNANGPTLGIRDGGTADQFGDYKKVGFDCSGLAIFGYAAVGINLPHYSAYQYNIGSRISRDNLQPGDLVFWARNTSDPTTIHHVAIYLGNDQIVEARQSGTYVQISPMRWNGYIGASRPGG